MFQKNLFLWLVSGLRHTPFLWRIPQYLLNLKVENQQLRNYMHELILFDTSTAAEKNQGKLDGKDLPLPPGVLRFLVAATDNAEWFLESGKKGMDTVFEMLERSKIEPSKILRMLDFGCGCGRVVRHFKGKLNAEIYGTDFNGFAINWCQKNLNFAHFDVNKLAPPMRYKDSTFDLIYAFSVFTHMTEGLQISWMQEMRRVLNPGGYLLVTLQGDSYLKNLSKQEQNEYQKGHMIVVQQQLEGSNYCSAFHPEKYTRLTFAKGFLVLDFVPKGARGNPTQDIYLLQKPMT
jgi:ubiquinone/menaquinone biosynthesis C-methylase UbiE